MRAIFCGMRDTSARPRLRSSFGMTHHRSASLTHVVTEDAQEFDMLSEYGEYGECGLTRSNS